jgi:sugar/nucleoside kinase (ribokinase family)
MKYDVLALGSYFLDLIFCGLDGDPELGREVYSHDFSMLPGGTYNSVTTLHRLGVRVAWAVDFGNDAFSLYVKDMAEKEGLDPVCFASKAYPLRNITVASSYRGDRQFISFSDPSRIGLEYIKRVLNTHCRVLFLSGLYRGRLLSMAAGHFKKAGTLLVMDGNSSDGTLADRGIQRALQQVDVFMPNSCEACRLTGKSEIEACLKILGQYSPTVVIKAGAQGAYATRAGKEIHVPSIQVRCMDTTGAGDCFDAGFMKAYLDGLDLEECLQWGNIAGGLSTRELGGTGYKMTSAEVQRLKKRYYKQV